MSRPQVLVVGGANVDVKVTTSAPTVAGLSTPGRIHVAAGGVARNVAEALARLGARVRLLAVVGDDPWGEWLMAQTAAAGVDTAPVIRREGQTGIYVTVDGHGIADTAIVETTPADVWLPVSRETADLVVLDANPPEGALAELGLSVPRLMLVGTSPAKVVRFRQVLRGAWLIALTHAEARALLGVGAEPADNETMARAVRDLGPQWVLLTAGGEGLGLLGSEWRAVPAQSGPIVNPTGAGDTAAAVVATGLLHGWPAERVLPVAARAAGLTLRTWGNVHPDVGNVMVRGEPG